MTVRMRDRPVLPEKVCDIIHALCETLRKPVVNAKDSLIHCLAIDQTVMMRESPSASSATWTATVNRAGGISESLRTGATPTVTLTSEAYQSLKPSV